MYNIYLRLYIQFLSRFATLYFDAKCKKFITSKLCTEFTTCFSPPALELVFVKVE